MSRRFIVTFAAFIAIGAVSCSDASSSEPTPVVQPSKPANPTPTTPTAPAPAILATFDRISPSSFPGTSRYILYKDSSFALEYTTNSGSAFRYPGRFTRTDSLVRFSFTQADPTAWVANAIVRRTVLVVRYNDRMLFSDFEDGDYLLSIGEFSSTPE
ncbi:MAG TPA: hypothetical protein VNS10_17300 [Gemmatimonadaceae bacterium]|nr:hypothetical protein [Gemmatimonadaceae bacterium]